MHSRAGSIIPANFKLATAGDGHWTKEAKLVQVTGIGLGYVAEDLRHAELRLRFDVATWNTAKDGLIYTDDGFLQGLRTALVQNGFSSAAAVEIDYSEAGMQGDNFVSFDVGQSFVTDFLAMNATAD